MKINTIKDIIDEYNFKKNTGIFDINSGGFESHSFHSHLRLGDILTMDIIAFNVMQWDTNIKKGWNLLNSNEKYLGELPGVNSSIRLYYWIGGKLNHVTIKRITEKVFEVIE